MYTWATKVSKVQSINPRVIYLLLIAAILIPLFLNKIQYTNIPSKQSTEFYDTVNAIRNDDRHIVLVDGSWSQSTRGENYWQLKAILTHLMSKHIRFALLSFDPQIDVPTMALVRELSRRYPYQYGVDYIDWGYRPDKSIKQVLKGLVINIPGTLKSDWKGRPLTAFPIMKKIHDVTNISAIIEVTNTDLIDKWLGLVQGINRTPLLYATTAIGAPNYYPYLDSRQLSGMLTGVKGAGDYEQLIGEQGFATRATGALSFVYALIIGLVIIGNIGQIAGRWQRLMDQNA